jgi:hypothetical protein
MRLIAMCLFLAASTVLAADDPKPKEPAKPHREKPLESKDAAKLFKAESWKQVQSAAELLLKEKSTDFLIDSIATAPKLTAEQAKKMSADEKEKFFHGLVSDRAKADKMQGIYILICKSPTYLYVGTTGDAHFPSGEASKMRVALLSGMRDKKPDEALLKVVNMALEAKGLGEKK